MPDRQPYRDFNFRVEIDGIGESQFSEVSIPEAEITVVEYREGADKSSATRKLPGRVRYGNLVLKRGVTGDLALWECSGRSPRATSSRGTWRSCYSTRSASPSSAGLRELRGRRSTTRPT